MECPHAARCPGCPGLGLDYPGQLTQKRGALCAALGAYESLSRISVGPLRGAPETEAYRARAKLVVSPDGAIGLYERGTHRVVDIPECRILRPALAEVARQLRGLWPAPFALTGVDLRDTDAGVLVTLIVEPGVDLAAVEDFAAELGRRTPAVAGLAYSVRAPDSPQLLGQGHVILSGPEAAPQRLPGLPWHLAAHGAFVQAHAPQAAELYRSIMHALSERLGGLGGRRLLELYAGSGALSLALAERGASVTAIESFGPAARRIEQAARAQGLAVVAAAERAEQAVARLATNGERFDAVIVNPPRRGLSAPVRSALLALGARAIAYVSCNPATLARDLDHLIGLGSRVETLSGWDMLPHSAAVEALAVLAPCEPPTSPVVVHQDDVCLVVAKPAHLGNEALLGRVRRLPGAEGAVPLYLLDEGTSGLWLLARRPEAVARCSAALERGEAEYVALLKGIARAKGAINRRTRTRYARDQVIGGHSLSRVRPEPMRRGEPRKHLAAIGHPVLGDGRWGDERSNRHFEFRHGLDRPFFHLSRLVLAFEARELSLALPLPADLAAVVQSLARPAASEYLD